MKADWHTVKAGLRSYLVKYARDHAHPMTRLTHLVGIPLIVAAIPVAGSRPRLAAGLFASGWALQFLGHYGYEKKSPSFFQDPRYLLVGPIWVLLEVLQRLGISVLEEEAAAP